MSLIQRTKELLQRRRDKVVSGGINTIPSPFIRFSDELIGIEQQKMVVITAGTKGAKTQFASFMYLYHPLLYAYKHPDKIRLKIFYYPLEETPEEITERFMSFLLNKLTHGEVRLSPTELMSSKNNAVSQEVLNLLDSDEYNDLLTFFEEHVEFSRLAHPTGIYNEVKSFMEENGKATYVDKDITDEFGAKKRVRAFDHYVPNDPDLYVLIIVDHISLITVEQGTTLKQSMDRLSDNLVKLRNRYGVSPIVVQQQSFEGQSLDAFKYNKLEPSAQGLADTKYTARNTNILLGLFNPADPRVNLTTYEGYDITKLGNNVRFLEVCLNRGGRLGGKIGLFFDGATCDWRELPRPEDKTNIERVYKYIDLINNNKSTPNKLMLVWSKITNLWEKL